LCGLVTLCEFVRFQLNLMGRIMDYTNEDQEQLRRLVEDFVTREVKPYWRRTATKTTLALFRKMGELGLARFLSNRVRRRRAGLFFICHVLESVARLGSLSAVLCQYRPSATYHHHFGNRDSEAKVPARDGQAELLEPLRLTEPHAGSDAANINTRANCVR